jgi:thiol-disulfide isomerase/thioredoxin
MKRKYIQVLIACSGCLQKYPIKTGLEGKTLPSFNILLQDSTVLNIGTSSKENPVILYYFNPSCPYCRTQMQEIIDSYEKLRNIQFYVFTTWPYSEMKSFYDRFKLYKYPEIKVGVDMTNFFASYFDAKVVPFLAIYGKDKKLKEVFIGKIDADKMKEAAGG